MRFYSTYKRPPSHEARPSPERFCVVDTYKMHARLSLDKDSSVALKRLGDLICVLDFLTLRRRLASTLGNRISGGSSGGAILSASGRLPRSDLAT